MPVADQKLERLTQLLVSLRAVNRILHREKNLPQLLQQVCESLTQTRGYVTIWMGRPNAATQKIQPLAAAGKQTDFIWQTEIRWDKSPQGCGPTGTAVRERRAVVFDDLVNDARYAPWRDVVPASGVQAIAALPLFFQDRLLGTLTVGANRRDAFDPEEMEFLSDLAADIARAWQAIEDEAELTQSRENLRTLIEAIPDAIFFKDGAGRWLVINETAKKLFRLEKHPWQGRTDTELGRDRPEFQPIHDACIISDEKAWQTGQHSIAPEFIQDPTDVIREFEVHKLPLFHPDGRRKGLVIAGRDMTVRRRAEEAQRLAEAKLHLEQANLQLEQRVSERTQELVASENQIRNLIANMVEGVLTGQVIFDAMQKPADLLVLSANPAFENLSGEKNLAGKKVSEIALPVRLWLQETLAALGRVARTQKPEKFESHFAAAQIWLSVSAYATAGDQVVAVLDNITQQKRYEEVLIQNEARVRRLVQHAPIPLAYASRQGEKLSLNNRFTQLFGYDQKDMPTLNDWWQQACPQADYRQQVIASWKAALSSSEPPSADSNLVEFKVTCKNGTFRIVKVSVEEMEDGWLAAFLDQTERQNAERALRKSEERYRILFEATKEAILITSPLEDTFLSANPAALKLFGLASAEQLRNPNILLLSPPTQPDGQPSERKRAEVVAIALREGSHRFEWLHRRLDGQEFIAEVLLNRVQLDGEILLQASIHDISARKRAEESLTRAAAEINDLYDNAPCGYHSLNADGCFTRINNTELKGLGYTREELIGRNVLTLLPPGQVEKYRKGFQQLELTGRLNGLELDFHRKDGTLLSVMISATTVTDKEGHILEIRGTAIDNSERKKITEELQVALRKAGEASRAKGEFLARMSHEIRTPMNAILGYTQLLHRDHSLSSEAKNKLAIINQSGENLLAILNSVLDLAKIEAGRMTVLPVVFNLTELVHDLMHLFGPPAEAKKISLHLTQVGHIPSVIRADQNKIRQILINLLANAVKFTQTGGVSIEVSVQPHATGSLGLAVNVADTGPGIAPEEMGRLFEKFEQTSTGLNSHTGTGLGLAISRQYARLLGGDITVQSQPGQGSTFRMEIPVELVAGTDLQPSKTTEELLHLIIGEPTRRILIVDDQAENRELLAELLNLAGFETRTAGTVADARHLRSTWLPHLLLVAWQNPGSNGKDAIRELRADTTAPPSKIIGISSPAEFAEEAATRAAGADDFLTWPVNYQEMLTKIGRLLDVQFTKVNTSPIAINRTCHPAPSAFAALPNHWRDQLCEALFIGDFTRVTGLINQIKPQHPAAAEELQKLASQFDADGILNFLGTSAPANHA